MTIGLRVLLLIAAIVCFIVSVFSDIHPLDWVAVGLACTTAAVLVRDLGWDRTMGRRRRAL